MTLVGPPPVRHAASLILLGRDLLEERSNPVAYPPGETNLSMARTKRFAEDPLGLLLESYERFGPVFTLRIFHGKVVFMLGPAANHYITVSHAQNFQWRNSHFRDLIGLLGDGLLTIDGEFHRRSRMIMLPAFHRERIASYLDVMIDETDRALDRFTSGVRMDLCTWTRKLALRIAMRALFGLDPDGERARSIDAARVFEQALAFYATDYALRFLRGPFTPWTRLRQAADKLDSLIYAEISSRRATGERGEDMLSLLLDAGDEHGAALTDLQIRDEVMTLLFAGHDTTTSTVAFMFYELARHPHIAKRLVAEQDAKLNHGRPSGAQLVNGELAELEMVLDETLRKYPPAWIGPRRSLEPFEFEGRTIPGKAYVNYCSWASHHLPDVFSEPEAFRPERFTPEAKAALPKGAYVPFGGGSRTCIGMRFGQLEIRTIATLMLSRFTLELPEDFRLTIRQMPTISPKEGLRMMVRERVTAGSLTLSAAS
jgi:cytochrome P450